MTFHSRRAFFHAIFYFTLPCGLLACGSGAGTSTSASPASIPSLSYSSSTGATGAVGATMTVTPSTLAANGASVTACGIKGGTTALPAGLTVAATTCVISGTPTVSSAATPYTLVATNAIGNSQDAPVTLTVLAAVLVPGLSYSSSAGTTGVVGATMTVTPSTLAANGASVTACGIKGGTTALPAGLTVAATTCVISGTPTVSSAATPYTLVATNAIGNSQDAPVTLTVLAAVLVPGLSYSSSAGTTGVVGATMTVTPSTLAANGASVTACGIKGGTTALPAGLTVAATTCVISGIPNSTLSATPYTLVATNSAGNSVDATVTLTVNAAVARAYVSDPSGGVYTCSINQTTGVLTACGAGYFGVGGWLQPLDIVFYAASGNIHGYAVSTNGIAGCDVDALSGNLSCLAPGSLVSGASFKEMSIKTIGGNVFAYFTDLNAGKVYQCAMGATTGSIDSASCVVTNGGIAVTALGIATWKPYGIALNTIGGNTYAYIGEQKGNIYVCPVDAATGLLGSCTISNGGFNMGSMTPFGVTVSTIGANTYAYVAGSHIVKCTVSSVDGTLSSCAISDGGAGADVGWYPTGISISNLGGANSYAYIAGGNSMIYMCSVDATTGALVSCAPSVQPPGNWLQPRAVTILGP